MKFEIDKKIYTVDKDLHTHTVYSRNHAFGTIEENVLSAREKGIKTLGITDHGPGHILYGIKREDVPKMKEEIQRLNEKYRDIRILLGVEANIINKNGMLDVRPAEIAEYDYIAAGYHYGAIGRNPVSSMVCHCKNFLATKTKKEVIRLMKKNTSFIVNALEKNDISILTHPGDKAPVDLLKIAVVCKETDTLVEINTSHLSLSADDLKTMALSDCKFVINSDAHKPDRVGDMLSGVKLVIEAGIDLSRVINLKEEPADKEKY